MNKILVDCSSLESKGEGGHTARFVLTTQRRSSTVVTNKEMIDEFLSKLDFSSVNSTNSVGDTPLIYAVIWGEIEILQELIVLGAHIDHFGEFGSTALENAVCDDNLEAARLLLSAGADPDLENEIGHTARSLAEVSESVEIRLLLSNAP